MAKKYEQFEGVVCERMRRLRDKHARWSAQREKAFKARDAADAGLNETSLSETKKRNELLADYGESVRKMKDLDHKIRDAEKSMWETLQYAEQAELFPDPDTFNAPDDDGDEDGEGDKQGHLNDAREPAQAGA